MGYFAKYLRTRRDGGINVVKDPVKKKQFQQEIAEMVDPEHRQQVLQAAHEETILKSFREPTPKEVLEELARQCKRLRERRPGVPLDCYVGGYAMALLAQVRSYPEQALGLHIILDKRIPPWDTVVMYRDGKGKKHGGIL